MATKPHRPPSSHTGSVRRQLVDGEEDSLIREEPLLIKVDDQQVLTMRTPGDDLNLALGFLLSEGVIQRVDDIERHTFTAGDPGELRADTIELHTHERSRGEIRGRLTRTHEIRSSCGICGLTDPNELLETTPPLLPGLPRLSTAQIEAFRLEFEARQPLFAETGACHGAVIFDASGAVHGAGEDVGRHNALDKAIGAASRADTRAGHDLSQAIAVLSGRAGYDLTIKCLRVGIPVILSVSAASALSHDLCSAAGGTLVGFLREGRMKIYCDGGRITG
jgi:FdhD protein